jgi:deoxyribonucleoside regulator
VNRSSDEATANARRLSLEDHRLCARIARLYFHRDLTQEQIGDQLGLSRVKVNRMLRLAKQAGVVEVRIRGVEEPTEALTDGLIAQWGLRDAVVVADGHGSDALASTLASGASAWLASRLAPRLRVGFGLGRTISRLPETFRVDRSVECVFTEIEGAAPDESAGFASYNVTSRMGAIAGARTEFISAPTFVSDPSLRDRLLQEPSIARALDRARQSDIVIQSVGTVSESALMRIHDVLTDEDLDELRARGAVGDALGHYFDADGRHVPFWTDDMHVGLTLDDLTKVPLSALVAGGSEKLPAIAGALRGAFFNVLITDIDTARALMEERPS